MIKYLTLVIVLVCSVVQAAAPVPILIGPDIATPGDIVLLDASSTEGKDNNFAWDVIPDDPEKLTILVLEGGKKCILTTRPGTYNVILAVGNAEGVAIKQHTVRVTGKVPDDPDIPDDPDDPIDNSLSGKISRWETPRVKREELARSFESISSKAVAGGIATVEELKTESTEANRRALGESRGEWLNWFNKLQQELKRLNDSGKMTTLAEHAEVWQDIADGIRRAK